MMCLRIGALLLLLVAGTFTQDGFDLSDALDDLAPKPTPAKPKEQPKAPEQPKTNGGLDLSDAFGPDEPVPTKKPKKPSSGDSGGFGLDLEDALGPDPNPKPDKPVVDPPKPRGGAGDQPQEAGAGPIAGIASAIGVALLGAASSYFAYQKKKLCFKIQG
ncbi:hypothetical protein FQN60_006785, partial [Etheostoma spectabile]